MSHTTEEPHVTVYTEQIKTPTFIHIDDAQSSVFHNLCDTSDKISHLTKNTLHARCCGKMMRRMVTLMDRSHNVKRQPSEDHQRF